ncbi:sulfatase [bacterium]|nr:sulfatase [bacterium]
MSRAGWLRFATAWMMASAPFAALGYVTGRLAAGAHAYLERDLAALHTFAIRQALGPSVGLGLSIGLVFAIYTLVARAASGTRLGARRTHFAVAIALVLLVGGFMAWNWREWSILAETAAYQKRVLPMPIAILALIIMTLVQATLRVKLAFIAAAGLSATIVAAAAGFGVRRASNAKREPFAPISRARLFAGGIALLINAVAFAYAGAPLDATPVPGSPPVILISIDTLRADHMSVYGYRRDTTPHLAKLAAEGTIATQFVSQAPWTLPSHTSMLTGLSPTDHGVVEHASRVPPRTALASEYLKARGYKTMGVVTALLLAPSFGFTAGFERYEMNIAWNAGHAVNRALALVKNMRAPTFLFLHVFDPHFPYAPPRPFYAKFGNVSREFDQKQKGNYFDFARWVMERPKDRLAATIARYDEEIAYTDDTLGGFFEELKRRGIYDRAWIVVVSDHGEEFLDHGSMGHSATMYEELSHVPFIVKAPNGACAGARIDDAQIPQSAVLPLLLAAATTEGAKDIACTGPGGSPSVFNDLITHEPVLAESRVFGPVRFMARLPEMKLHSPAKIEKGGFDIHHDFELYDLANDPRETENIYVPGAAPALESAIAAGYTSAEQTPDAPTQDFDPATRERLKALGYLN